MFEAITAEIPYTVDNGEVLVNESFGPKNIHGRRSGTVELKTMTVLNGRVLAEPFSLDDQGLVFVEHKTKIADFFDEAQVRRVYYPEIEQLMRAQSGASRVAIFDHALRSGDPAEREKKLIRNPVLQAHNDYTEWSGPNRLREILPDEADELLQRRFAIIQVWRAINRPIQSNPLALADARSVAFADLMVAERRYPHRVGQTYRLRYNPAHRWIYFPEMRRDEAVVFKVYDSDRTRARFTGHTSFTDPTTRQSAPARQSIEMRAFAFFA
jgi:hypothetical protein